MVGLGNGKRNRTEDRGRGEEERWFNALESEGTFGRKGFKSLSKRDMIIDILAS
ncbi:unnamed protein product [Dovyalis caffra]|uniref:Uncharacterized protein n=1 Tax=Dovyalis caffra TaxID=77055 RepID=A0AAV1QPT4_9ROSI|nr:unnamed protein product [Dovyalis caffra]